MKSLFLTLFFFTQKFRLLKFRFSEKAQKFGASFPLVLNYLPSENTMNMNFLKWVIITLLLKKNRFTDSNVTRSMRALNLIWNPCSQTHIGNCSTWVEFGLQSPFLRWHLFSLIIHFMMEKNYYCGINWQPLDTNNNNSTVTNLWPQ